MPQVTIEYYGVSGTGRNVTEAKRDAGRKIEQALSRSVDVRCWRGHTLVVAPTAYGASYVVCSPDDDGPRGLSCSCGDFDDAWESGVRHLIDLARTRHEDTAAILPRWIGPKLKDRLIRDCAESDAWRDRYDAAIAEGRDCNQAHAIACGMAHMVA